MNIWNEIATKFKHLGAAAATEEIAATLKEHSQTKLRTIVDKYNAFGCDNGSTSFTSVNIVVLMASREGDSFKAILGTKSPLVRLAVIHYEPTNEV